MLTVTLFVGFLFLYAYLFVPSKRETTAPINEVLTVEVVEERPIVLPVSAAMTIACDEMVISLEELAELEPMTVEEAPNYAAMGVVELRKACSDRGLQWRRYSRVNGKKKATAISRNEMLQLLMS